MNATTYTMLKRAISSLLLGIGLVFAVPADVSAHTVTVRPGFVRIHYVRGREARFPRWLLHNRDFRHWYWHSCYRNRLTHNPGWKRLYDIYRLERRHRWPSRRFRHNYYHHRDDRRLHRKRSRHRR